MSPRLLYSSVLPSNRSSTGRLAYGAACVSLAAAAAVWTWIAGHRGIFLFDQSAVFDGAWRILQGQAPYRDFVMPFGPIAYLIQALFFRLFGVNWAATVLPACLTGALATLSVMRSTRLFLGGGARPLACCAGLATAVNFQAPFGTFSMDQTALFFDLLALQAVAESLSSASRPRRWWQAAAGFLLVLAILSKQSFGVLFAPVLLAVLWAGELPDLRAARRAALALGSGTAAAAGVALALAWRYQCLREFLYRTVVVAGHIGGARVSVGQIAAGLFMGPVPNVFQPDMLAVLAGAVCLFLAIPNYRGPLWRELAPAAVCAFSLPLCRSFIQSLTLNEWQNNLAFLGLAAAVGFGLLLRLPEYVALSPAAGLAQFRMPTARAFRTVCVAVAALWGVVSVGNSIRCDWTRVVQQFQPGTVFRSRLAVRGLEGVLWGEPTVLGPDTGPRATLRREDFEATIRYLAATRRNFFVMGDSTLFYGLLSAPSPQPLLYFQSGHSFVAADVPRLDEWMESSLKRHDVRVVVGEKITFDGDGMARYRIFPRVWAWFQSGFRHTADFGNYEIWERAGE